LSYRPARLNAGGINYTEWILGLGLFKCLKIQARAFASFPWNRFIFILSVVMEEVTPQQCSPNVSYMIISEFFKGIAQFTVWTRVNICYRFHRYLVPTQFQKSIFVPLINPSKYLVSGNTTNLEISSFLRRFCLFETRVLPTLTWPRFDTILFL
jgi:hypothetical protein